MIERYLNIPYEISCDGHGLITDEAHLIKAPAACPQSPKYYAMDYYNNFDYYNSHNPANGFLSLGDLTRPTGVVGYIERNHGGFKEMIPILVPETIFHDCRIYLGNPAYVNNPAVNQNGRTVILFDSIDSYNPFPNNTNYVPPITEYYSSNHPARNGIGVTFTYSGVTIQKMIDRFIKPNMYFHWLETIQIEGAKSFLCDVNNDNKFNYCSPAGQILDNSIISHFQLNNSELQHSMLCSPFIISGTSNTPLQSNEPTNFSYSNLTIKWNWMLDEITTLHRLPRF